MKIRLLQMLIEFINEILLSVHDNIGTENK